MDEKFGVAVPTDVVDEAAPYYERSGPKPTLYQSRSEFARVAILNHLRVLSALDDMGELEHHDDPEWIANHLGTSLAEDQTLDEHVRQIVRAEVDSDD